MDDNHGVSRFSPATKRYLHKPPPASEKSRKERFQKLSLVGTRVNPKIEMVADQEDEQIISMLAAKRFKLPRKFLDEDHASVPRKLRSAMKKRNTGSLSPSLQDPKKTKLHPRGRDSPKTDTLKKIKKQKRMDRAKSIRTNGSITKDEEEVVETLYALAGMFGSVADGRSGAADESSQDPTPTVNEAMESPKLQGIYEVSLREETAEAMNSKPKNEERADMLDSFEEAKQGKTHVLPTTEPSSENLPIGLIIDSRSTATNLEQQTKGPVLWPGLLRASRNSIPSWNEASLRSSCNYKSAESCYSTDKICKTTAGKAWRNKCTGHVYISHLIRRLQNPDSNEWLSLQDGREAASKQGMVNIGSGVAVLQNHCNGDVSTNLHQKRNSNGSYIAQMNCTEKQSFDFLSLSNRSGTTRFQVPYLQSYPQHHIPTIHPDHQIHYSTVSSQQLQLLPYHLGSSGRSSLQKGPTREHPQAVWRAVPQIASSQYGSRQVEQFPSWQNGRVESSSASLHDLMAQYNSNHHQQQLQQYVSLPSSMAGPSLGKRQDLVGLPSVVCEETAMRFHRGSSLSLQLLCNDRL